MIRGLAIAVIVTTLGGPTFAVEPSRKIAPYAEGFGAQADDFAHWRAQRPRIEIIRSHADILGVLEGSGPRLGIVAKGGVYFPPDRGYYTIKDGGLRLAGHAAPGGTVIAACIYQDPAQRLRVVALEHLHLLPHPFYGQNVKYREDVLQLNRVDRLFINHCSLGFSADELIDLSYSRWVTVSWCQIGYPLDNGHAMGLFFCKHGPSPGDERLLVPDDAGGWGTSHHNLYQRTQDRNPLIVDGLGESIEDSAVAAMIGVSVNHRDSLSRHDLYYRYASNTVGLTWLPGGNGSYWQSTGLWRRGQPISGNSAHRMHLAKLYVDATDAGGKRQAGYVPEPWRDKGHVTLPLHPWKVAAENRLLQPVDWTATPWFQTDYISVTQLTQDAPRPGQWPDSHQAVLARAGAWPRNGYSHAFARDAQTPRDGDLGHPADLPSLDMRTDELPTALTDWLQTRGRELSPTGYLLAEDFLHDMHTALLRGDTQQQVIARWLTRMQ